MQDLSRVRALALALSVTGEAPLTSKELLWLGASPVQREFLEALWESGLKWYDEDHPQKTVTAARALVENEVDDDHLVKWAYERIERRVFDPVSFG